MTEFILVRCDSSSDIGQGKQGKFAGAGLKDHRQGCTSKSAMERHSTVPDGKNLGWILDKIQWVVENDITKAATENDPEGAVEQQIIKVGGGG